MHAAGDSARQTTRARAAGDAATHKMSHNHVNIRFAIINGLTPCMVRCSTNLR